MTLNAFAVCFFGCTLLATTSWTSPAVERRTSTASWWVRPTKDWLLIMSNSSPAWRRPSLKHKRAKIVERNSHVGWDWSLLSQKGQITKWTIYIKKTCIALFQPFLLSNVRGIYTKQTEVLVLVCMWTTCTCQLRPLLPRERWWCHDGRAWSHVLQLSVYLRAFDL